MLTQCLKAQLLETVSFSTRSLSDLRLTARFLPFSEGANFLLASSEPPSFAFAALHGGFSSLSLSALFGNRVYDSPPLLLRCQNTHVAQLRLSFCRLASGKNHQKSPRSLKIRQTPIMQNMDKNCLIAAAFHPPAGYSV